MHQARRFYSGKKSSIHRRGGFIYRRKILIHRRGGFAARRRQRDGGEGAPWGGGGDWGLELPHADRDVEGGDAEFFLSDMILF